MRKNKKFIISVVLVVILNAFGIFSWYLMFSGIHGKRDAVLGMREEIEAGEQRLSNAKSLKILMENLEKEEEKIASVFLGSQDFIKFIEKLEFLASGAGVEIKLESAALPSQKEQLPVVRFRISGSFEDVFHYLFLLENLPYQINFEELGFVKTEKIEPKSGKKNVVWETNFTIKLLSYEAS